MGVVVSRCGTPELPFKGRSLVDWLNGAGSGSRRPGSTPSPAAAAAAAAGEVEGAVGGVEVPLPPPELPPALEGSLGPVELGGGWSRLYDVTNLRYQWAEDTGRLQVLVPEVVLGPGRVPRVRHVLCGERPARPSVSSVSHLLSFCLPSVSQSVSSVSHLLSSQCLTVCLLSVSLSVTLQCLTFCPLSVSQSASPVSHSLSLQRLTFCDSSVSHFLSSQCLTFCPLSVSQSVSTVSHLL